MATPSKRKPQVKNDNQLFDTICELAPNAIFIVGVDGRVRYANGIVQQIMGRSVDDVLGEPVTTAFPEFAQNWQSYLAASNVLDYEAAQYCRNSQKWLYPVVRRLNDELIVYVHDVTEFHQQHIELRRQETTLRTITDNILDGVVGTDVAGTIQIFNPAAEKMTGYSASELIGKNVTLLMDDSIAKNHDQILKRFVEFGKTTTERVKRSIAVRRKDGTFLPAEISVSRAQIDENIFFVASLYDVSGVKEKEDRIRELARFPEETWNPVLKISADGVLTYTNTRCQPILKAWNVKVNDRVPPHICQVIDQAMKSARPVDIEVDCGSGQYFSVLFAPVPDLKAVYVYGRDVSIQKAEHKELLNHRNHLEEIVRDRTRESEEARDEANRASKAKSIFLANMSHEIRTPLTSIIGYSENLLDPGVKPDYAQHAIKTIIRSGHHLKNIINDILDISKIEAEKLEVERIPVNIFELLADVQSIMDAQARSKNLEFHIDYEYPLPKFITSDPMRLKQILINLCGNAVKFTMYGRVTVRVSCQRAQEQITFIVEDSGIGIDSEQQKRLFKAFAQADNTTTRKFGGTGLGLALSKQLAIMLGGDITVTSELNKGSRFTIHVATGPLPESLFTNEESHMRFITTTEEIKNEIPVLQGSVLLVEDTIELQDLIAFQIRKSGATVTIAANGQIGVEKALAQHYDVIYMDMQMPVMDGYTAVKTLRSVGYAKPIVAMTANAMREDREKCLAVGCDDFISKPIHREQLFKSLDTYLNQQNRGENETLVSELIKTEPDMADLVKKFLDMLPGYIDQCRDAYQRKDWTALQSIFHKLKGMGGGYGYSSITDTAALAEHKIKDNEFETIMPLIEQLATLHQRALRGLQAS